MLHSNFKSAYNTQICFQERFSLNTAILTALIVLIFILPTCPASAKSFDNYEYIVIDNTIKITGYTGKVSFDVLNIDIPETIDNKIVTSIGDSAFEWCWSLTSVAIPSGVTHIEDSTFGCYQLQSINVHPSNPNYSSKNGVLFNKDKTILIQYPRGKTDAAYEIPSGVTGIENSAFAGCSNLTAVTIPSGVTSIGDSAFKWCDSLTAVTIPFGVTSIGDSAFAECYSLSSVTIPTGLTSIENSAFKWCNNLTVMTIPSSVTSIGDSAFAECNNLTTVTIPSGVKSIGNSAFKGCNLTSITIPCSITSIRNQAFGCHGLQSIDIHPSNPNYSSENGVLFNKNKTTLIQYPSGKTGTTYEIPSSVTSIGDSAFYECDSLTAVTIPSSVSSIGDSAFNGCSSLTTVTISSGVISIENSAFKWCRNLTAVTIPFSVTSIGAYAFYKCDSLTAVTIPSSISSIGDYAFWCCDSLESIDVHPSNLNYSSENGVLFDKNKTTLIQYPIGKTGATYEIPSGVSSIGDYAFISCDNLTAVTISSCVTSIGGYAFAGCSSLTAVNISSSVISIGVYAFYRCGSLTAVTIPSSITSIGESAFVECNSLTAVTIPSDVKSIGDYAFAVCGSLESIDVHPSNPFYSCEDGVLFNKNKTTLIQYPIGKTDATYKIPSGVINIGDHAFLKCVSLTAVTIPTSVTDIGYSAFWGCNSLMYALFSGDAPGSLTSNFFSYTANYFKIYYHAGTTGFTTPTWKGYDSEEIPSGNYMLIVESGSGTGIYVSFTSVAIKADPAPDGQSFDKWTGNTVDIMNMNASSTTISMVASDIAIAATYVEVSNRKVNLTDAILAIMITTGIHVDDISNIAADCNNDGKIDLTNGILILQMISGLRNE